MLSGTQPLQKKAKLLESIAERKTSMCRKYNQGECRYEARDRRHVCSTFQVLYFDSTLALLQSSCRKDSHHFTSQRGYIYYTDIRIANFSQFFRIPFDLEPQLATRAQHYRVRRCYYRLITARSSA
jgi:hypothetical protein